MRDMKLRDRLLPVENARHENAEQYFAGSGGKCGAWKWKTEHGKPRMPKYISSCTRLAVWKVRYLSRSQSIPGSNVRSISHCIPLSLKMTSNLAPRYHAVRLFRHLEFAFYGHTHIHWTGAS